MQEKKYSYVYKITNNKPRDQRKYYIGVRSCDCDPKEDDYWSSCNSLLKHIRTYAMAEFSKEILFIYSKRDIALAKEIELHEEFDVARNPEFYNQAKKTATGFTLNDSPEIKEKRRKSTKKYWRTHPEVREAARKRMTGKNNPFYGRTHSETSRKKIGEASKGRIPNQETRDKMSKARSGKNNYWYGKTFSKEYRQKISENHADVSGSKNPSAKTYILTSPEGEIFTITGGINKFCKEHNLVYGKRFRSFIGKDPIPNGNGQGWSIKRS